jgi:hypothetical protein
MRDVSSVRSDRRYSSAGTGFIRVPVLPTIDARGRVSWDPTSILRGPLASSTNSLTADKARGWFSCTAQPDLIIQQRLHGFMPERSLGLGVLSPDPAWSMTIRVR